MPKCDKSRVKTFVIDINVPITAKHQTFPFIWKYNKIYFFHSHMQRQCETCASLGKFTAPVQLVHCCLVFGIIRQYFFKS